MSDRAGQRRCKVFENLNFNVPVNHPNGSKVGRVELSSGVAFEVWRQTGNIYSDAKGKLLTNGYFVVKLDLFGTGIDLIGHGSIHTFATQKEVIAYLARQVENNPQYSELKAKRKALGDRLKPLQDKWIKTGEAILNLAKK